ncbi:MAG TPA: hypothetical protein VGR34_06375 [Candidatus Dormibacteraeota bacterium]|nr:hypothetical protein [Candidatus Dormibacteraeota bacterium]
MASESEKQLHIINRRPPRRAGGRLGAVTQRLMLHERLLAKQERAISKERKKIREQISQALALGAALEPGPHTSEIVTRRILRVR